MEAELDAYAVPTTPADLAAGKSLWHRPHFVWAVVAQFFCTCAQGGTWAFFILLPAYFYLMLPTAQVPVQRCSIRDLLNYRALPWQASEEFWFLTDVPAAFEPFFVQPTYYCCGLFTKIGKHEPSPNWRVYAPAERPSLSTDFSPPVSATRRFGYNKGQSG